MIGNTDKETKIDLLTINNTPLHVLAYAGFVIRETGGYWSTEYASALHIPSTSDFVKSFMNPYQSWDEMESIMKNFKSLYNKEFEVFSLSYKDIKNAEYTIDYINYLAITGDSKICKLKSILSGKRIFEDDVEFTENWKENFELSYSELPSDCDVFYLGTIYWKDVGGEQVRVSPHLVKYTPLGLHAYMVRRKILVPLIKATSGNFIDVDFCLIDNCPRNIYVADPLLVTEKSYNNGNRTKEGIWRSLSSPELLI